MTEDERQLALSSLAAQANRYAGVIGIEPVIVPEPDWVAGRGSWQCDLQWHPAYDGDDPDGWWFSLLRRSGDEIAVQYEVMMGSEEALLFELFSSVTHEAAMASAQRVPGMDIRRYVFSEQERLLGLISMDWASRKAIDHRNILKRAPFQDNLNAE